MKPTGQPHSSPKKAGPIGSRGRPREFDTHAVLASASQVFWNHGYHA
ncbi:TetR/AcrR family transcriptional regulator, partial [Paraburkholderia sp. SIMBA_053]